MDRVYSRHGYPNPTCGIIAQLLLASFVDFTILTQAIESKCSTAVLPRPSSFYRHIILLTTSRRKTICREDPLAPAGPHSIQASFLFDFCLRLSCPSIARCISSSDRPAIFSLRSAFSARRVVIASKPRAVVIQYDEQVSCQQPRHTIRLGTMARPYP